MRKNESLHAADNMGIVIESKASMFPKKLIDIH